DPTLIARMKYDPARLAFGPDQEPIPEGKTLAPLRVPETGWDTIVDQYLARPGPIPPEADDVEVLSGYKDHLTRRIALEWDATARITRTFSSPAIAGQLGRIGWIEAHPMPVTDEQLALPVLAIRLARRALAANPDRDEGYHALSVAYRMRP